MEFIVISMRDTFHSFKVMLYNFTHICFNGNHFKAGNICVDVKNI